MPTLLNPSRLSVVFDDLCRILHKSSYVELPFM
jgi:hypothetical protein